MPAAADTREFKVIPVQTVAPMQPVILMHLNPPQRDYLFLSIAALCFFIPLAIPAIIFSLQTRKANLLGNQEKAQMYSRLALGFSISSILVALSVILFSMLIRMLKKEM